MSAWLLNKYEIDVLVHWLHKTGVSNQQPDSLGALLWSENYRSIRYRYWDENKRRPPYTYSTPKVRHYHNGKSFDPEDMNQALKMVHFYDYQTCEHPQYQTSRAKRMMDKLETVLVNMGADWHADNLHWGSPHGGYKEETLDNPLSMV